MKNKIIVIIGIIIFGVSIVLGMNYKLTKIIYHNLFPKKYELDTSVKWDGGKTYERLQYSDVSENTYLDLYVPDNGEEVPLFVLIHGGGFMYGDSQTRQAQFMYRYFRDQGYACASVNYRLAQEEPFPGAIEDVKAAIRFLKANAQKYGYDADKVAVWGESAGGYLCLMAGVTTDEDFHNVKFIGEDLLEEPVTSDVDVIVDFYGCADIQNMDSQFDDPKIPGFIFDIANMWIENGLKENGGDGYHSVEEYWLRKNLSDCTQEEIDKISPYYYIEKNQDYVCTKNIMIWHGDADITVPLKQSSQLAEKMKEIVGTEKVSYTLFENLGHAADTFYNDDNLSKIKEYLDTVL